MTEDLAQLSRWLRERRPEIEERILARAYGIADPSSVRDPDYAAGLRDAVSAAVDYCLLGLEGGAGAFELSPPTLLLDQARRAARSAVGLDTVLRRYIAGHLLLGDFTIRALEAEGWTSHGETFRRIWQVHGALLDSIVDIVSNVYRLETEQGHRNAEDRLVASVTRLLEGHLVDPAEIPYPLDGWHIGVVGRGAGAREILSDLAKRLDRRLLLVPAGGGVWAWLGGRTRVVSIEVERLVPAPLPDGTFLTLGESEHGLAGWRLTHRQARAADRISRRSGSSKAMCYSTVSLLASAAQDEVLINSLQRLYLDPLAFERDGGATLRKTLRAYMSAHLNVSSAAARLGISRQTVTAHLRTVEERIGCSVVAHASEIGMALRLEEFGYLSNSSTPKGRHI